MQQHTNNHNSNVPTTATVVYQLMKNSTMVQNSNLKTGSYSSNTLIKGIFMGIGISLTCCLIIIITKKIRSLQIQTFRSSKRRKQNKNDDCVCYMAMDSSIQGLMHDPETCERDCSNKQKQSDAGLNLSKEDCSGDCNDCSVQSCHQKYSF